MFAAAFVFRPSVCEPRSRSLGAAASTPSAIRPNLRSPLPASERNLRKFCSFRSRVTCLAPFGAFTAAFSSNRRKKCIFSQHIVRKIVHLRISISYYSHYTNQNLDWYLCYESVLFFIRATFLRWAILASAFAHFTADDERWILIQKYAPKTNVLIKLFHWRFVCDSFESFIILFSFLAASVFHGRLGAQTSQSSAQNEINTMAKRLQFRYVLCNIRAPTTSAKPEERNMNMKDYPIFWARHCSSHPLRAQNRPLFPVQTNWLGLGEPKRFPAVRCLALLLSLS